MNRILFWMALLTTWHTHNRFTCKVWKCECSIFSPQGYGCALGLHLKKMQPFFPFLVTFPWPPSRVFVSKFKNKWHVNGRIWDNASTCMRMHCNLQYVLYWTSKMKTVEKNSPSIYEAKRMNKQKKSLNNFVSLFPSMALGLGLGTWFISMTQPLRNHR